MSHFVGYFRFEEMTMPIKKELLDILACPACHGEVVHDEKKDRLNCQKCRRSYPIRDSIPVMLIDEAIILEEGK